MRDIRELLPTDDPVNPDLLIGRADDVRDLASRLKDGMHMVMAGPRRTGKSTVGLAALKQVSSPSVYTAHVDLWDHESSACRSWPASLQRDSVLRRETSAHDDAARRHR